MNKLLLGYGLSLGLVFAGISKAHGYGFTTINGGPAADQFSVDVTAGSSAGQAVFTFHNIGPIQSSITDIYFQDGTLLGVASISSSAGVDFSAPATPGDLPGGNSINPPFVTTRDFSMDSNPKNPGTMNNGVNNYTGTGLQEWVSITFDLINGKTYTDTIAALESGALRIGLKVQGFANGASYSYINGGGNNVPDAATSMMLLGMAMVGLETFRRKIAK